MKKNVLKLLALAFTCTAVSAFAVACGGGDLGNGSSSSSESSVSSSEDSSAVEENGLTFKTLSVDGLNVYGEVEEVDTFSFASEIQTSGNATFQVSKDQFGSQTYLTQTVPLQFGDNVYYVFEMNGTQVVNTYTVTIHRRSVNIFVYDGGTITGLTAYGKILTEVSIPSEINGVEITAIGEDAFRGRDNLTSVVIGNRVTSIGNHAFAQCYNLTSVVIGNRVTSIGNSAFSFCSNLTSIEIPNSVTSIGKWAFDYCSKLTSIEIPNSVTSIGYQAFFGCTNLTSVVIGNGVASIGISAFSGCTKLTKVYYAGTAREWDSIDIDYYNEDLTNATRYYYVENEADVPMDGGKYWHYVDGVATAW